jgi:hypothetical protein
MKQTTETVREMKRAESSFEWTSTGVIREYWYNMRPLENRSLVGRQPYLALVYPNTLRVKQGISFLVLKFMKLSIIGLEKAQER